MGIKHYQSNDISLEFHHTLKISVMIWKNLRRGKSNYKEQLTLCLLKLMW